MFLLKTTNSQIPSLAVSFGPVSFHTLILHVPPVYGRGYYYVTSVLNARC